MFWKSLSKKSSVMKSLSKLSFWDLFFKIICGISAIVFLVAIICKLKGGDLTKVDLKYLLLGLGVAVILPFLTQLDAFGVKLELRKKVEAISGQLEALPDYVLGSEAENEQDIHLAKNYYKLSLEKNYKFWPSILALASLDDDDGNYDEAIAGYKNVLKYDNENVYALNNLASAFLYADLPNYNTSKALEYANKALEIIPTLGSALFYKGEALNRRGSYSEAYPILNEVFNSETLPKALDDVLYEMIISNSNLGRGVRIEELNMIYFIAKKNDEVSELIGMLKNNLERDRFIPGDLPLIDKFLIKIKEKEDE
jgi:tetratricopeptide (TPR) repeat protein